MAYKFQLGDARLSGSVIQEGNITADGSKISGSTIGITDASGIAGSGLSANGGALDLDVRSNRGLNLHADGLEIVLASNKGLEFDSGNLAIDLSGSDHGLNLDGGGLRVQTSGSSLEINGDGISVNLSASGGIEEFGQDGLRLELANNSGLELDPGGLSIELSSSNALVLDGGGLELKSTITGNRTFSDNVTIDGNLTVTGTTVEVDAAFVVTASIQFEGTLPDDNEITLTTANPTADQTITLPDLTGHVPLVKDAISSTQVSGSEFGLLSSLSTVETATVADGDAVLFNDADDTMKQVNVTSLKTYFQSGVIADSAGKLERDINTRGPDIPTTIQDISSAGDIEYFPITASATANISGSYVAGEMISIKAGAAVSDSVVLTISASHDNASELRYTFDGQTTLTLESSFAAVDLIYLSGSDGTEWIVM